MIACMPTMSHIVTHTHTHTHSQCAYKRPRFHDQRLLNVGGDRHRRRRRFASLLPAPPLPPPPPMMVVHVIIGSNHLAAAAVRVKRRPRDLCSWSGRVARSLDVL